MPRGKAVQELYDHLLRTQTEYARKLPIETQMALNSYQDDGSSINYYLRRLQEKNVSPEQRTQEMFHHFDNTGSGSPELRHLLNQYWEQPRGMKEFSPELELKLSDEFWDRIKRIDDAVEGAPTIDEEVPLYRAVPKFVENPIRAGRDPAFVSTSLAPESSVNVISDVSDPRASGRAELVKIIREKNRPFLMMDANPQRSPFIDEELEVLLPRRTMLEEEGIDATPRDDETMQRLLRTKRVNDWMKQYRAKAEGGVVMSDEELLSSLANKYKARESGGLVSGDA
jgi:hypothetical protein